MWTPRWAPIASALRSVSGALAGAIDEERDLALAGGLDELERRLEHVLVVAVDDRRDRRPVESPIRTEAFTCGRGVRHGLHENDDAHEAVYLPARGQSPLPSNARATTRRWICWVPS